MTLRDAVLARHEREAGFEQFVDITKAEVIAIGGSVDVSNKTGYVWVREYGLHGGVCQVFSPYVQARAGLAVLIATYPKRPARRMIICVDWEIMADHPDWDGDPFLPRHHRTHECPDGNYGADVVMIYPRALSMLRTTPGNSTGGNPSVHVSSLRYEVNGEATLFAGREDYDISGSVPGAGLARYVLIYLDTATNTIGSVNGDTTVDSETLIPDAPDVSLLSIPSALVRLAGGDTGVSESGIVDVRMLLSRVTGQEQATMKMVANLERQLDVLLTRLVVELIPFFVKKQVANLEHEIDIDFTRHLVGS